MIELLSQSFFPIFAVIAFVAVVLLIEALYLMWNAYKGPEAKKIGKRLRALSAGADRNDLAAVLKGRMLSDVPAFERLLLGVPRIRNLDRMLLQSGLEWTVAKLFGLSFFFGIAAWIALSFAALLSTIQFALAIVAALLPSAYARWKRAKRLGKMEKQLPEALDLLGRALRAGHALPSGLQMAGQELPEPIAAEFRTTNDEVNFGISMQQALSNLSERVPITDVRYFVVAVLVQREAGGNLTEVLDNLSMLIRNRLKFRGRVRVLTTEGRLSAWVLGLLPFFLAAMLNLVNPGFISVLWTDPVGVKITNYVLGIMGVGAFWLYKLVKVRV